MRGPAGHAFARVGRDAVVTPGPRGALGQVWRVAAGAHTYALKEIRHEPPTEELIAAELNFAARAAAAGIRLPASHPDRDGRYLVATPEGTWLRLYDWVELRPLDPPNPAVLGDLLARLHRCARPAADRPVEPWYDTVPATVRHVDAAWAAGLVAPADPADLIVCHRDLHPENVLAGPGGEPVVVDWDNLGPATPARELAQMLFDWFYEEPVLDVAAMRALFDAYVRAGGPGRITRPGDFSMLLATRLNFLLVQTRVAGDPDAAPRDRQWARREIAEAVRIMPSRHHLDTVLAALR